MCVNLLGEYKAMETSFEEARICVVAYASISQGKRYVFDNNNYLVAINIRCPFKSNDVCFAFTTFSSTFKYSWAIEYNIVSIKSETSK